VAVSQRGSGSQRGPGGQQESGGRQESVLIVDFTACDAHGLCAELLPELIWLDEWGYPMVRGAVPPGLLTEARRAVAACPMMALRLATGPASGPAPAPASAPAPTPTHGRPTRNR